MVHIWHLHFLSHGTHMNGNGTGWTRIIGCLIFIGHFPQTNPIISGSFAKKTCNLRHLMGLLHPVHTHSLMSPQLQRVAACCSVLQCVLQDINDGASCTRRYIFTTKAHIWMSHGARTFSNVAPAAVFCSVLQFMLQWVSDGTGSTRPYISY